MNNSIDIICPLYNAINYIDNLNKSLLMQENVNINKIRYILTESKDSTEQYLKSNNLNYKLVKRDEFSHSLTREKEAFESEADILVFISQDIVIDDKNWLEKLVKPIINNEVEASYSRQLTKFNNIEKYVREFNYPAESMIKSDSDIEKLGIKTFFFSDAASAIKRRVFVELNGYDHKNLPINEDMYFAHKLITYGYKIKYCADSYVYHSHKFTLKELYNRYKLTGQFFKQNDYLYNYKTTSSGVKLAKYILKRILKEFRIVLLFRYPFDMAARFFGMRAGEK